MNRRYSVPNNPPSSDWVGPVSFVAGMMLVIIIELVVVAI